MATIRCLIEQRTFEFEKNEYLQKDAQMVLVLIFLWYLSATEKGLLELVG